jgi:Fuc2NAc and GlcNAc transferase
MIAIVCACTLLVSALLTGLVRHVALRRGVLDVPNARSSHVVPTPRGGGVAIVLACLGAWIALRVSGELSAALMIALAGGGTLIALVGVLDDHRPLAPWVRLLAHFAAAGWAIYWLGGMPPLQLGTLTVHLGVTGHLLGVLGVVWVLNLFNFMDGIDGIAASEAIFIACAAALLSPVLHGGGQVASASLVLAAASAGFLLWNWPPARLFMGDVGSGFLGYVIAVLAIAATAEHPAALMVWLILGALFFVDSTVTLVRRLLRKERVHQAHRSHAYQALAARHGHRRVTVGWTVLNVFCLLPCAWMASRHPVWGGLIAAGLLVVLGVVAYKAGAGQMSAVGDKE